MALDCIAPREVEGVSKSLLPILGDQSPLPDKWSRFSISLLELWSGVMSNTFLRTSGTQFMEMIRLLSHERSSNVLRRGGYS